MLEMIALFFPSFVGVSIADRKRKLDIRNYLLNYSIFTVLVNGIICVVFYLLKKELFFTFTCLFFAKYCLLSLLLNIVIGLMIKKWKENGFTILFRRKK